MYEEIIEKLNRNNATLVAVSKTHSPSVILGIYEKGQRDFGENKVQELVQKYEELPKDIHWHMIGHLQTNKVKQIAPFIQLIHSADSFKLLKEINKQAKKHERVIDCLLQIRIAREESKFGLSAEDAEAILNDTQFNQLENIRITGLMGMATFTSDQEQVRSEFKKLRTFFEKLKQQYFQEKPWFTEISMGMSGDYKIALEQGSTMVRIGSLVFGPRK